MRSWWSAVLKKRSSLNTSYCYLRRLYCETLTSNKREFYNDEQTATPFQSVETSPVLKLNERHQKRILSVLNDLSAKTLCSLTEMESTQSLVKNILEYRLKNGKISSVNELLKANVGSYECLQSMCKELQPLELLYTHFCHPGLLERQIEKLQSIVVIDINVTKSVTWIKVNRQLEVEDWNHVFLSEELTVNLFDHVSHHQMIKAALAEIPGGCVYIIREPVRKYRKQNLYKYDKEDLYNSMLRSIFMTMLRARIETEDSDVQVVDIKRIPDIYKTDIVKHFGAAYVNNYKLLRKTMNENQPDILKIQLESFPELHDITLREQHASVALLANSFYKLVLCDR
ncbi:uncharacterized protein LOC132556157 [Ylistrum balloti]|uniref:uncharacterized protein LOC132556157 n=1 Tax=Ylistrum balloti TaxID=509963 RepID=UPI002905B897|nr:uncharacterized protein LOC132556157 [Ylistrum balloti]